MKIPSTKGTVGVVYEALGGVDLSTQARFVSPSRSPKMCNMYKAYADGYSDFLETRPGRQMLYDFGATVHGLYDFDGQLYVQAGGGLYTVDGRRRDSLGDAASCGFAFDGALWLLDGQDYYRFDGRNLTSVEGLTPITSIGRAPAGGGTAYQPVNLLTNRRTNTFRADGVSTVYALDAVGVTVVAVTVNNVPVSQYTVNGGAGTVTFASAPTAAEGGDDNVAITFTVETDNRRKVTECRMACVFDNRVFVAGGEKGLLRHCRLSDPTYFADTDWYREGECAVTALAADEDCLYAFTEQGVCRHAPQIDYDLGRTYPTVHYALPIGCEGFATAFFDDIVWLSPRGVEGLADGFGHRSTLIDADLSLRQVQSLAVWDSYLCLLADGVIYLADGRAPYRVDGTRAYEWFVWQTDIDGLYGDGRRLYWHKAGRLGVFGGETDEGEAITSYFETRAECAGDPALRKKVGRAGAVALLKCIVNSDVAVTAVADGKERELCTFHMGGLDFGALDFNTLSFTTSDQDLVHLPLVVKDYQTLTLRFGSTRRFGVGAVRYRVSGIQYVK